MSGVTKEEIRANEQIVRLWAEIERLKGEQRSPDCEHVDVNKTGYYLAQCSGVWWERRLVYCPDCGGKVIEQQGKG